MRSRSRFGLDKKHWGFIIAAVAGMIIESQANVVSQVTAKVNSMRSNG